VKVPAYVCCVPSISIRYAERLEEAGIETSIGSRGGA